MHAIEYTLRRDAMFPEGTQCFAKQVHLNINFLGPLQYSKIMIFLYGMIFTIT